MSGSTLRGSSTLRFVNLERASHVYVKFALFSGGLLVQAPGSGRLSAGSVSATRSPLRDPPVIAIRQASPARRPSIEEISRYLSRSFVSSPSSQDC